MSQYKKTKKERKAKGWNELLDNFESFSPLNGIAANDFMPISFDLFKTDRYTDVLHDCCAAV